MDKQRVLPPFEAAIRELGVTAESNTQCHDHVRGQTDADDGLGPRAIPFPRPEVAVNSNEADQRFKKRTGARIVRLHADAYSAPLCDVSLTRAPAAADTDETMQTWHGLCTVSSPQEQGTQLVA
jgi:hypothetical protein